MKRISYMILLLAVVACNEIFYKEPQPRGKKALSEIPAKLRGKYLLTDDKSSDTDTLVVTAKSFQFNSGTHKDVMYLGDSLVLKYFKGYYFFNNKVDPTKVDPSWILRVIRQDKNGDIHSYTMETTDENFDAFLIKLGAKIKIDSSEDYGVKFYEIDPSPKELVGLIEAGFFKQELSVKKVN